MTTDNTASPSLGIATRGLTKSFGNQQVLRGIDLEIEHGERVVIMGTNGAGKTTLIKLLATIIKPSSGTILIHGLDSKSNAEAIRRHIGVVTHPSFLYNNLTAYENLDFYSRMFDVPRPRERIQEVAALVGMTARLHTKVGTLSRGMQQRLSVARSVLHKPSIMLLDEPETGLDQQASSILRDIVRAETEERRTVILTTHNLERGLELGDRLIIIARGKVAYEGLTQTLNLADLREVYQQSTGRGYELSV